MKTGGEGEDSEQRQADFIKTSANACFCLASLSIALINLRRFIQAMCD